MEKATFKLDSYRFVKASLNFDIPSEAELNITINPKGSFYSKEYRYILDFEVVVKCKETETDIVTVTCSASFTFNDINSIDDIPNYFYPNSIAIIFPYIRAFVSTISLQANVQPVILPTINLMGLTEVLKNKTQVIS
jgi:preprotein translocase subunit SecB